MGEWVNGSAGGWVGGCWIGMGAYLVRGVGCLGGCGECRAAVVAVSVIWPILFEILRSNPEVSLLVIAFSYVRKKPSLKSTGVRQKTICLGYLAPFAGT